MKNYIDTNKESWNKRTAHHIDSDFYDVAGFLKGNSSLNSIELDLLGDLKGKSVLHLQCHFGQDTLSMARLGAEVTGVDLSDAAIEQANILTKKAGMAAEFICCDIYDLPKYSDKKFDIVFTSYGTIGWLPDLDRWAQVISGFLKKDGMFVFAEFHPVVWMFDDDFEKVGYNYFNSGPIVETESGTYADRDAPISQEYVCWNHGIAEVLSALIKNDMELTHFQEFDYSPYNCFKHTVEIESKKFRIKHLDNKIPMVYALSARKK